MSIDISKDSNKLLILLLLSDLGFIVVHVLFRMELLRDVSFNLEKDRGYAEIFQYIKEYWIMVILVFIAIKRAQAVFFAWAMLFVYFLFDDAYRLHERLGISISEYWNLKEMLNLRPQDYGELIVTAIAGSVIFSCIGVSYCLSSDNSKTVSKVLFALVLGVVFFGVIVDMAHYTIPWGTHIWGLLEDGGEMIMMSIIVWYVFDLTRDLTRATPRARNTTSSP
jgi:hypothetical protein